MRMCCRPVTAGIDAGRLAHQPPQGGRIPIAHLRGHLLYVHWTGNFALSMMLEPAVLAPVLCQPSLPLNDPAGLEISPADIQAVRRRLDGEQLTVLAYRFEGDKFCRAMRVAAYAEALGGRFTGRVLPDSAANPDVPPFFAQHVPTPHSVVTAHLVDEAGQPTMVARDEILAFFAERLSPARPRP